eukprot:gb/GECH01011256.1/.p1 GENE.gb/GECH01011256.1/~~gb/GECH01011256.1/.p1  ORF type:complete len:381 (+),score=57.27 gb/GECH01011256.1/:1-1143(+)
MATSTAFVSVYSAEKPLEAVDQVPVPDVLKVPIRTDVINFVHSKVRLNQRQPHAVAPFAGEQTSAESWGTGRAVARIPRVGGGGTHRSGQGAFGNMCRGGRMFGPTKIWRRWHRNVNQKVRKYATSSAIAASAVTGLVMARGHKISRTPEVPLVVDSSVESFQKTKQAVQLLKNLRAFDDVRRVKESVHVRPTKGKRRNRRLKFRRGPLVVYKQDNGIVRAFRNIPGVDVVRVDYLSVLDLAPGGHVGRFVIWTQPAFAALKELWGSFGQQGQKSNFMLPRPTMTNADVQRVIKSDEVKSAIPLRTYKPRKGRSVKYNLRKNNQALNKVNPYAYSQRVSERRRMLAYKRGEAGKPTKPKTRKQNKRQEKKDVVTKQMGLQ